MEFLFLRIMKGRLLYRGNGLSLYIQEPTRDVMYESVPVYEDAYQKAYFQGVMIKEELDEFLFENELYTPFDDSRLERLKKSHEELKLQAYREVLNKRALSATKANLRANEKEQSKINFKKSRFHHLACEGVADLARWGWILEQSVFFSDGTPYDWGLLSVATIFSHYENSAISSTDFRTVARSDFWRPVWSLGKKTGDLFDRPSSQLTRDQLMLCSYSSMYDNAYESSESPGEKVIEDDDCLDGWFIDQKRKYEKQNKEKQVEDLLKNSKAKNASEIFLVAQSPEEAKEIHALNSPMSENARRDRMAVISEKGSAGDLEFSDVQTELSIRRNQESMNTIRGRK